MKVAVIGAGKMGRWFMRIFLAEGIQVVAADVNKHNLLKIKEELGVDIADNKTAVRNADKIMVCVPMTDFHSVIREISSYVKPNQVIIDICTFKEVPIHIMHRYIKNGTALGSHPLFGPFAKSLKNQNFILTPTNPREEKAAKKFKRWLEGRRAKVFFMSPRKHDRLMTVILRLPRFLSLALWETNKRFPMLLRILYVI